MLPSPSPRVSTIRHTPVPNRPSASAPRTASAIAATSRRWGVTGHGQNRPAPYYIGPGTRRPSAGPTLASASDLALENQPSMNGLHRAFPAATALLGLLQRLPRRRQRARAEHTAAPCGRRSRLIGLSAVPGRRSRWEDRRHLLFSIRSRGSSNDAGATGPMTSVPFRRRSAKFGGHTRSRTAEHPSSPGPAPQGSVADTAVRGTGPRHRIATKIRSRPGHTYRRGDPAATRSCICSGLQVSIGA